MAVEGGSPRALSRATQRGRNGDPAVARPPQRPSKSVFAAASPWQAPQM